MSKRKNEMFDVHFDVSKKMVAKFLEIVEGSTLQKTLKDGSPDPSFDKKRLILRCCVWFVHYVAKSWSEAYDYSESCTGERDAALVLTAAFGNVPPHSHGNARPIIPSLAVRPFEEGDSITEYNVLLGRGEIQCLILISRFLGTPLTFADFQMPTKASRERLSIVINTLVYYSHMVLLERGKAGVRSLNFRVRTDLQTAAQEELPFRYSRKDFMDPFLKDFCQPEFFGRTK